MVHFLWGGALLGFIAMEDKLILAAQLLLMATEKIQKCKKHRRASRSTSRRKRRTNRSPSRQCLYDCEGTQGATAGGLIADLLTAAQRQPADQRDGQPSASKCDVGTQTTQHPTSHCSSERNPECQTQRQVMS